MPCFFYLYILHAINDHHGHTVKEIDDFIEKNYHFRPSQICSEFEKVVRVCIVGLYERGFIIVSELPVEGPLNLT